MYKKIGYLNNYPWLAKCKPSITDLTDICLSIDVAPRSKAPNPAPDGSNEWLKQVLNNNHTNIVKSKETNKTLH